MGELDTLYARWLSGDLSPNEIDSLKKSGEWSELESIIKAADQLVMPAYDKDAAFNQIKKTQSSEANIHPLPPRDKVIPVNIIGKYGIAASVALLIGAFLFLQLNKNETISASYAQNKLHALQDDSQVTLNDGSSITYDDDKWAVARTVSLKGEALFKVTKGVPFSIITKNGNVDVLGTEFNVRAWGDNLYVQCYTGKVRVSHHDQETIITKGQSVNVINGIMTETKEISIDKPAWTEGSSHFEQEEISEVLLELERQYAVQLSMPEMNETFSGNFTHSNLKGALEQICKPMNLGYNINSTDNSVTISK